MEKSRYAEIVDFLCQKFVSSVVWKSGHWRKINIERKWSRNSDNYPFCSRIPLLRNCCAYMNRSILLSNFCLHGWVFVLEDSAIKPWKVIYLNTLPVIRLFFSMWVNCLCPSVWLTRQLLVVLWWDHKQNTQIFFLDTRLLQILISPRVYFFNLLLFWQRAIILQHKDFRERLIYLYSWWFSNP